MKRVFVGVKASPDIEKMAMEFAERHKDLPVRWIKPKNLHFTLVPPWQADEKGVKDTISKLENASGNLKATEVTLDKADFGPDPDSPYIIYAGGPVSGEVIRLWKKINKALGMGTSRPYWMHITLARFHPEGFRRFPQKILEEKILWTEVFNNITLFESIKQPGGTEYEIIRYFSL